MRQAEEYDFLHAFAQQELSKYDRSQEQLPQISEVREFAWCIQMLKLLQGLKLLPELLDG